MIQLFFSIIEGQFWRVIFLFLFKRFVFNYVCGCVQVILRPEGASDPVELELQEVMSLSTWVLGLSPAPTNGFLCFPAGGQPVVLQHLLYLVRLRDKQASFSFIGWPSATLSPKLERTSAVLESQ